MARTLGVEIPADVDATADVVVPVDAEFAVDVEVAVGGDVVVEALHPTRTKQITPATLFLTMCVS